MTYDLQPACSFLQSTVLTECTCIQLITITMQAYPLSNHKTGTYILKQCDCPPSLPPLLQITQKLYSSADNVIGASRFTYSHIPPSHIWRGPCLPVGVLGRKTWARKTYSLGQNMSLYFWLKHGWFENSSAINTIQCFLGT